MKLKSWFKMSIKNEFIPLVTANLTSWGALVTDLLSPLATLMVSIASFLWVFYKFKNEQETYYERKAEKEKEKQAKDED